MTHGWRRGLSDPAATRLKTAHMPFKGNTPHPPAGRSRLCGLGVGSPSAGEGPSRLRLVKTPQPDTLSPRERAGGSRKERSRNVYEKKGGEGDDSAPKGRNNKAQANGLGLD